MLKKLIISTLFVAMITSFASAHTLMMLMNSNGDGTVTVSGVYSTGAEAANTPVYLLDANEKKIKTGKTDEEGEWTYDIPKQPYTVFLDGGEGHQVSKEGFSE